MIQVKCKHLLMPPIDMLWLLWLQLWDMLSVCGDFFFWLFKQNERVWLSMTLVILATAQLFRHEASSYAAMYSSIIKYHWMGRKMINVVIRTLKNWFLSFLIIILMVSEITKRRINAPLCDFRPLATNLFPIILSKNQELCENKF